MNKNLKSNCVNSDEMKPYEATNLANHTLQKKKISSK